AGMPDSFRVNEISIKIKKKWHYLYRSVDSESQAIGSLLSATRDAQAAERFFHMPLWAHHRVPPRVITVDIHAAYAPACKALQQECRRPASYMLRPCPYVNSVVEQDHCFVKHLVNAGPRFGLFRITKRALQGCETMYQIRKAQIEGTARGVS